MKIYTDYDNSRLDAAIDGFENCVSALILQTMDGSDLLKLSEVKGKRKYLIRFSEALGHGANVEARFYADDKDVLAKMAKSIQQEFKVKDLDRNISVTFESASGRDLYGGLYSFKGDNFWVANNSSGRDKDGCFVFDFEDGFRKIGFGLSD